MAQGPQPWNAHSSCLHCSAAERPGRRSKLSVLALPPKDPRVMLNLQSKLMADPNSGAQAVVTSPGRKLSRK
jgi:hypothetical protein